MKAITGFLFRKEETAKEGGKTTIRHRAQVDTGFLGINWAVKDPSLRFYRIRPLSKALAWLSLQRSPKMDGPRDLSDLLAPGQAHAANLPYYYVFNPVHKMSPESLGWMHPRMGKRIEKISEDFTYASYENIRAWIETHIVSTGIQPNRIIDLATGTGVNAFVYAELFPDAEVIGVDLAPSLLRWARRRAAEKGLGNLRFYHMDAGDLSLYDDDTFDIVHEGMVFHEMPGEYVMKTLHEMVRVCKPGGIMGFSDWGIPETPGIWKKYERIVESGVEPFMVQYARTNFPEKLRELGCQVEQTDRAANSAVWKAVKGPDSNRLLAERRGEQHAAIRQANGAREPARV